jgi:hypothetical protein
MKIGGLKIEAMARATVRLPRPDEKYIEVKVRAFPLGDESPGDRLFPEPTPPQGLAKQPNGLDLRDPRSGKAIVVDLTNDPTYLAACEKSSRMQLVVSALNVMEEVEFDSAKARGSKEWYEEAYEEMKAAGLTLGDLNIILKAARDLSNLNQKKLEAAAEGF